jgi:signal transduction histidine kinase
LDDHRVMDRQRTRAAAVATALLIAAPAIAVVDLASGLEFSFSIFYVIPAVVAAWFFGRGLGVAVSIVTGLSWAYAESVTRVASLPAATWNRGTRILVLIAFAYLIDLVRRHQEDLRKLLTQRDEFLSLIAHELRAPVAAIEIVATGLTRAPDLGARERHALDQLRDQAHGLAGLAEGLLSVGQLEAGLGRLDRHELDLRAVVTAAAAGDPRVRTTVPDAPVVVAADPDAIRRAIVNVVGNALKFSPAGRSVEVTLVSDPGWATLRVTDEGIGLDSADVRRLFRKYGRIRSDTTAHIPGVGLGLYFTRLVMDAHGGTIDARSPGPGEGATFELRLPLSAPAVRDRPSVAHDASA